MVSRNSQRERAAAARATSSRFALSMSHSPMATSETTWKELPREGYGSGAMSLCVSEPTIATPRSRSHGQQATWKDGVPASLGLIGPSASRRA